MKPSHRSSLTLGVLLLFLATATGLHAADKTAAAASDSVKTGAYQKLFKDKTCVVHQAGVLPMHLVDGVLYVEFPKTFEGQDFSLHSQVEAISSLRFGYPGKAVNNGFRFTLGLRDSTLLFTSRRVGLHAGEAGIQAALDHSTRETVLYSFPVKAQTPDSSAWVVDLTSLFVNADKRIASLSSASGMSSSSAAFSKENSFVSGIEGYASRAVVRVNAQYNVSTSVMGFSGEAQPMSARLRMVLAPVEKSRMTPVEASARIGTQFLDVSDFAARQNGAQTTYYAAKWELEGREHLTFYVDTLLPPVYRNAVMRGIENWNPAFAPLGKPGFLEARPFPQAAEDSLFDAFDPAYCCVHFVQSSERALTYALHIDSETGEISHASLFLGTEYMEDLQRKILVTLAAADPQARALDIPADLLSKVVTAEVMASVGACLGLTVNHAASYAYPADSLRSASFTQRYGLGNSVLKAQPLNKVAQAGDKEKGVVLVQDFLGPYDYYALRFLYGPRPFDFALEDPLYRYAKPGHTATGRDPFGFAGQNASNPIEAARYTLKNLEYVAAHAQEWVDRPEAGEGFKSLFIDFIWLSAYEPLNAVAKFLGGARTEEAYAGDPRPVCRPVPKALQQECLRFLLTQPLEMEWMNQSETLRFHSGPVADITQFFQANVYQILLFGQLRSYAVAVSEEYPYEEMLEDIYAFALDLIQAKGALPGAHQVFLSQWVAFLKREVAVVGQNGPLAPAATALTLDNAWEEEGAQLPRQTSAKYFSRPNHEALHFQLLGRLWADTRAAAKSSDPGRRAFFLHLRQGLEAYGQ